MVNSAALARPRGRYEDSVLRNGTKAPKLTFKGKIARRRWDETCWHLMIEEKEIQEKNEYFASLPPKPKLTEKGLEARERWLYGQ